MKTSNKLLIAATLMVIGSIVAFDFSLRAEYLKRDYKKRFYNKNQLSLKDFDAIEDNTANFTDLTVEQGPEFGVWIDDYDAKDDLIFTIDHRTLHIDYKKERKINNKYSINIICPNLKSIVTRYKSLTALVERGGVTTVSGFKQDTMNVKVNNATLLALTDNNITLLNATVNSGILTITQNNTINTGNFDLKADAQFNMLNTDIKNARYKHENNAALNLSGKPLELLLKQ
ncbi:hypothetical protein [Mucilaginibacter sp. UYCu711]|uniref:hypothetical protein n=1 Tax=Mucilaginibacter sp. UYCu711 TaxID=3156339 RepID=UPI003D22228D